jgi:hypothetical protein
MIFLLLFYVMTDCVVTQLSSLLLLNMPDGQDFHFDDR